MRDDDVVAVVCVDRRRKETNKTTNGISKFKLCQDTESNNTIALYLN